MDDLISRRSAIETVNNMRRVCDTEDIEDYHELLLASFNELPPRLRNVKLIKNNHSLTLEMAVPDDVKIGRILVVKLGTNNKTAYYPD